MDGASNNGVEHVRSLIENIQYLPVSGIYRIHIIDEVHMLSKEAFNALLKTLEEPPKHAIFIFATTDPDKIPGTILSRCQRFDLREISEDLLTAHLKKIVTSEKISVSGDHLLRLIAVQAKGSVRDALSSLDQVLNYAGGSSITEDILVTSLGLARTSAINSLMNSLYAGDIKVCSTIFRTLLGENVPLKNVALAILDAAYQTILGRERPEVFKEKGLSLEKIASTLSRAELFWIYETLAKDFKWTIDSLWPREATELALQKVCLRREFFKTKESSSPETSSTANQSRPQEASTAKPAPVAESLPVETPSEPVVLNAPAGDWKDFLSHLFSKAPALAAALEQGNLLHPISANEDSLLVDIGFTESGRVFQEYLNDETAKNRLNSALSSFFNVAEKKITTNFSVLDEETSTRSNFKSHADLELKKHESAQEKMKAEFLDLPVIREAERLFNTKIDRVILEGGR